MAWECLTGRGLTVLLRTGLVLCLLALASCGGQADKSSVSMASSGPVDQAAAPVSIPDSERFPPLASDTPSLDELQAMLDSELVRLGKDERTTSQAPLGNDNAVFDLKVSYFDLRQGAVLHWTERHLGDYDMNGLVNASDLTPLAQRWKYTVDYREASEAGVPWWPVGNPRDGGFSGVLDGKPGFNTPADQWRTARIDGDGNGEVNLGDITPIASHWQQNLDSWRVYRRAPGEEAFTLLLPDPSQDYTLPRSANFPLEQIGPDRNWAYRMHFADLNISAGNFEYYIAAFDSISGTEGSPSPVASIEFVNDPELPEPEIPGNKPPVASFMASPRTGDLPLIVNFDATASHDPDGEIVLYLWDWEGDGVVDASGSNIPLATHVYTEPGYWKPRLTIWDDLGSSATLYASINLEISQDGWFPPAILSLGADTEEGRAPLSVSFLPELLLPNGKAGLQFEWDWNGDGVVDSTEPAIDDGIEHTDDSVSHVFEEGGIHHCTLKITDNKGLLASAELDIEAFPNGAPLAVLMTVPEKDFSTDKPIVFDASASSDPDGDELKFRFDFDGDGVFELDKLFAPKEYRIIPVAGDHSIGVQVRDAWGGEDTAYVDIYVHPADNQPPDARINVPYEIFGAGYEFFLSSADSTDPDEGRPVFFWWDLDDDGTYEFDSHGLDFSHIFAEPGTYQIHLLVADSEGLTDTDTVIMTIVENDPPIAMLEGGPLSGTTPLAVSFDASGSSDPDGNQLFYYWKFDLFGPDPMLEASAFESHNYLFPGAYVCKLVVDDHRGGVASAELVVRPTGSGWNLFPVDKSQMVPLYQNTNLELELIDNRPAIAYVRQSVAGFHGEVCYVSSQDGAGEFWNEPVSVGGSGEGNAGSGVSLTDLSNGKPAISWQRDGSELRYARSNDFDGSSWSTSILMDSFAGYNCIPDLQLVEGFPAICWINVSGGNPALRFIRSNDSTGNGWSVPRMILSWDTPDLQRCRLLNVDGRPAVLLRDTKDAGNPLMFSHALDSQGSNWGLPQELANYNGVTYPRCDAAMIAGKPAIVFQDQSQLLFMRASASDGSSWSSPQEISSQYFADWTTGSLRECNISLVEYEGRPLILDNFLGLWRGTDADGSSWEGPISLPEGYPVSHMGQIGTASDLAIINSHPAIAFQHDHLFYAIYLP
ncbi:PKD domain-containing protein [bacterium]|nr:PKD domain-containing protein [bacterium]